MTVHVINSNVDVVVSGVKEFQYRKRYDSARNSEGRAAFAPPDTSFQYRKRYDSARNSSRWTKPEVLQLVFQYRKRYDSARNMNSILLRRLIWVSIP